MTHARSFALAALAALALSGGATVVSAQIVTNPASISYTAGNSYITDHVQHLDWYRFDNFNNTIGLSYNQVLASALFAGWSVASLAQVQGLETQFGWTTDTPTSPGTTVNFGLTDAMSDYLGLTGVFFTPSANAGTLQSSSIYAMTNDTFFTGPGFNVLTHTVTASETYQDTDGHGGVFFYGDYVEGEFNIQEENKADASVGTWLVRASAECNTRVCSTVTPEPASLVLVTTGLLALGFFARRRATSRPT